MNFSKKKQKMKKIKIFFLLALLFHLSCASGNYWKLRIELPGKPVLDLNQYNEIVITNFFIKKETKDFNLNKEIVDYFVSEIGQEFKGKIISKKIPLDKEELFQNEGFWKNQSAELKETVLLTGSAHYTQEIRKAILETRKKRPEDPFPSSKALAERRFYTLNLNLYFIDSKTGKALYKRTFKESKGYENPKQTAHFAFFDLIQRVKGKLFHNILGGVKIQERYLIFD